MRTFVAAIAIVLVFSAVSHAQLEAVYDPGTGAVTFVNGVEPYFGIRIDAGDGSLIFANGDASLGGANTGPFANLGGGANFMEWGNLLGFSVGAVAPAGEIMPAGLWQADLDGTYVVNAITLADTGTQIPVPLTGGIVPEPTTLALLGIGLCFIGRRRG